MTITKDDVTNALAKVEEPELHRSLVELGMVRSVHVGEASTPAGQPVGALIALSVPDNPVKSELEELIRNALGGLPGIGNIDVEFTALTDEERRDLRLRLHGTPAESAGSQPSHGHAEGRSIPFAAPGSKTRVLLIASGKGGVGKSSVTTNLAIALANRGHGRVAVIDADVWGFSIPRMLGVERPPVLIDQMIVPPKAYGVTCISMGFFVDEAQPVIWRGPMLHKALEQFLTDVYWDEPDFLVVDLPPGTGDISLSLAQFLPRAELYVVTTPQAAAQKVAQRAAYMAEKVRLDVKGVIENMSWFTGDDGKRYEIFGSGGGQQLAEELDVPLLGQVPLVPALREGGDIGRPIVAAEPDSEAARAFAQIAETIDVELAPTRRYNPGLKIL